MLHIPNIGVVLNNAIALGYKYNIVKAINWKQGLLQILRSNQNLSWFD